MLTTQEPQRRPGSGKHSDESPEPKAGEVFLPVVGWAGYEVSNLGRVRSFKRRSGGRILQGGVDRDGYRRLVLVDGPRRGDFKVARLVALAFLGPRPSGHVIAHQNGNPADDRASNIAYKTQRENVADKLRHGTRLAGERHPGAKLTSAAVAIIRVEYGDTRTADLADRFGVSKAAVHAAATGRTWRDEPFPPPTTTHPDDVLPGQISLFGAGR